MFIYLLRAAILGYQGTPPSVNWDHPPRFEVGPLSPGYQGYRIKTVVNYCALFFLSFLFLVV